MNEDSLRKMRMTTTVMIVAALFAVLILYILITQRNNPMLVTSQMPSRSVATNAPQQLLAPAGYQSQFLQPERRHTLLDVRTPEEFAAEYIPGAINIPVQALSEHLNEVPNGQPVVIYCRSGNRSKIALQILAQAGHTELYDLGGIIEWKAAGLPVRRKQ
jgi:phage shock protein E